MSDHLSAQERLLRQMIGARRCQVCRRNLDAQHIRLAARNDQLWICSVRCRLCRNTQVFYVSLKDRDLEEYISETEEANLVSGPELTGNDVLDMHSFLEEFDGDFKKLFD